MSRKRRKQFEIFNNEKARSKFLIMKSKNKFLVEGDQLENLDRTKTKTRDEIKSTKTKKNELNQKKFDRNNFLGIKILFIPQQN